jgi:RNase P/RNase MRP subunit p29
MSVVGEKVTIVGSRDPTKMGRRGEVVFETSKTLVLESDGKRARVEKLGTVLQLDGSRFVIDGADIAGRLEDRLRSKRP